MVCEKVGRIKREEGHGQRGQREERKGRVRREGWNIVGGWPGCQIVFK